MSTPAIRAISSLPLPLLVLRLGADHEDRALSPDDLALVAALLYGCANLHYGSFLVTLSFSCRFFTSIPLLRTALVADPPCNPTPLEVVRTELDQHLVPRNDANE